MFQFTTTNIINSSLDSNGTTAKYTGAADSLIVTRVGKFLDSNIVGDIEKRAYQASVLEVAEVTVPVIAAGLVARLDIDVRLSQQTHSEYANSYLYFKKPVTVEVIATGTAATDATALAAQINGLRDRFGHSYVVATVSTADIIITAKDPHQRIFSMKVLQEDVDALVNSIIEPVFEDVSASTFAVTTAGRIGFGNDEWMYSRITMRTLDRARPFGISQDERPVIGGMYTQYTLRYSVAKDHVDGISLANDTSITTHVFYVLSTLVAAFEVELVKLTTPVISEVYGGGAIVISGTTTLTNSQIVTLTANGAVGTELWVVVTGTSATVTDPATGEITADDTIDGDTVIKVTDSEGTVGTVTVTVA